MSIPNALAATVLATLALVPLRASAQNDESVRVVVVPPHVWDPPAPRMVSIDLVKFVGFAHVFYHQRLADHIAAGGALQVPTGLIMQGVGGGVQPEITFTLAEDHFDGFFAGASAWVNVLHYMPDSLDERGNTVDVPKLTELIASIAPTIGYYLEGPRNGLMSTIVVGAEYVALPGTDMAAGLGTGRRGWTPYVSIRMGYRW